ncbi:cation transporter [Pseudemcibacter aquimaris]|uniref:cation transporter n=1 Tax=Pseudemcibacter aquimaris TaxID=2857064 RepID=UPI00201361E7|nr:cation transporter [Pseudemcibacter aquimaris]MCC3861470.1 cation transporter [Pseudemcibacter aquimaris]WDU58239.1 cation transporter [Pseudemcibacter aquimaris]
MACCDHDIQEDQLKVDSFRKALWVVFIINAVMFIVEFSTAFYANSVSLQADALDFLGDSMTYGVTLLVLGSSLKVRASVAMLKGISMGVLGIWIFARTFTNASEAIVPLAGVMGTVGIVALVANVVSAVLLYQFRTGDSNMRSIWLCSRNDAIGNLAIIIAASGVFATNTGWPDFIVAVLMATLSTVASVQIIKQASSELKTVSS